ncbi:MAG: metalloregulator ArsR/SmtB family transcription factor [Tepidisphaeraceae bacterium]
MSSRPGNPDSLLAWMGSLGDPARLRMLRLLEQHELGVAELGDVLQLPQSTISRHLKILSDEGWLRSRRVGTTHLSALDASHLDPTQKQLWQLAKQHTAQWPSISQDEIRLQRRLRERQDDSRRFFTGAAAEWDKLRDELYGHDFGFAAMLALLPATTVVADLGCGTGHLLEKLAPHVARAIGVDNTPAMLKGARQRVAPFDNVEVRQGELEELPLADGEVDAALMVLALSYVAEPKRVVTEMARVIKPGGRAVVVDVTPHDREDFRVQMGQSRLGFDAGEVEELLTESGLSSPIVRTLPPAPNVRGPALFLATAQRA